MSLEVIKKIGIKNADTGISNTREIGAEAQYIDVSYDSQGEIIEDITTPGVVVDPTKTKSVVKVIKLIKDAISSINDTITNIISNIDEHKVAVASSSELGHIKIGDTLEQDGNDKVNVKFGTTAGTAAQGNDSRLSNKRANPKAITFGTKSYDGSSAVTINNDDVGAAPKIHSDTSASTYGGGNLDVYGHVKLSDFEQTTGTPNKDTSGAKASVGASSYALLLSRKQVDESIQTVNNNKCNLTNIAPVESSNIVSKAYKKDDLLIYNGQLYKVLSNIASGGTIITQGSNANVAATTFSEAFGLFTSGTIWIQTE